jgi:hypothetical protein
MTSMRNVDAECMPDISSYYFNTGEESETTWVYLELEDRN